MATPIPRRDFLRASVSLGLGLGLSAIGFPVGAQSATTLNLTGSIKRVHDPAIIKAGDMYYLFSTGTGIPVRKSADLIDWDMAFPTQVFQTMPEWAREMIPEQHDLWAPDISFYNDRYHLYYSLSTFGSNRSAIGLATNATLDFEDDAFEWVDHGMVIESTTQDNYNCIDPNLVLDADGVPWLAFGSFWSGIKMRRLDYETGMLSTSDDMLYSLATRFRNSGSVEAPFIIQRGDWYYLFVSFDFCCRGAESTYNVRVGRSEAITGPYFDRDGVAMLAAGGTQLTFPTERWRGPGHSAVLHDDGTDYLVYHAYDAESMDVPTLRITPISWEADGWLTVGAEG